MSLLHKTPTQTSMVIKEEVYSIWTVLYSMMMGLLTQIIAPYMEESYTVLNAQSALKEIFIPTTLEMKGVSYTLRVILP